MVISSWFQSTTGCPEPGAKATDDRGIGPDRAVAATAGAATPPRVPAVAASTRALPFLRMLAVPLHGGLLTASASASPAPWRHRGHLLTRVVPARRSEREG